MNQLSQFKSAQRGMSFIGLVVCWRLYWHCTGHVIAQVVPTVIEYQAILKAVQYVKSGSVSG